MDDYNNMVQQCQVRDAEAATDRSQGGVFTQRFAESQRITMDDYNNSSWIH